MSDVVVRAAPRSRRNGLFLPIGATLLSVFVLVAVFGGAIAPYDPNCAGPAGAA